MKFQIIAITTAFAALVLFVGIFIFFFFFRGIQNAAPPNPRETLESFVNYFSNEDLEAADALLLKDENFSYSLNDVEEEFRALFFNAEIVIIDGNSESENKFLLEVSAPDISHILASLMNDAFFWVFETQTEEELINRMLERLLFDIESGEAPIITRYVDVELILKEEKWFILPAPELLNALTGGLFGFALGL